MMVARGGRGDEARAEEALLSVCTGLAAPWVFTCLAQCQGAPAGTITVSWERSPPQPAPCSPDEAENSYPRRAGEALAGWSSGRACARHCHSLLTQRATLHSNGATQGSGFQRLCPNLRRTEFSFHLGLICHGLLSANISV